MKAAKYISAALMFFCLSSCAKQQRVTESIAPHEQMEESILSYCGIQEILDMKVAYAYIGGGCMYSYKDCEVNEPQVLRTAETLLSKLPAKGSSWVRFRTDIPVCGVAISDASGKRCDLIILGNRLRCPRTKGGGYHEGEFHCDPIPVQGGGFYCAPTREETEFVNLVKVLCPNEMSATIRGRKIR